MVCAEMRFNFILARFDHDFFCCLVTTTPDDFKHLGDGVVSAKFSVLLYRMPRAGQRWLSTTVCLPVQFKVVFQYGDCFRNHATFRAAWRLSHEFSIACSNAWHHTSKIKQLFHISETKGARNGPEIANLRCLRRFRIFPENHLALTVWKTTVE